MKKKMIIGLVILIILFGIGIVVTNTLKIKKDNEENIKLIKKNYDEFTIYVKEYNEIRSDYISLVNDFFLDDYPDKHDEFDSLFTKYNEAIKKIDSAKGMLSNSCKDNKNLIEVKKICNGYGNGYEKIINLYIGDVNKYNDIVKEYNNYNGKEYSYVNKLYDNYIDYNNDSIYEGVNNDEED